MKSLALGKEGEEFHELEGEGQRYSGVRLK